MPLTAFETLAYNGFTFPVETLLTVSNAMRYDSADRTVVATTHTLSADFIINTGTNENDLPGIRASLERPGQSLTLTGTGLGDLSVNGGNGTTKLDVSWGPKPRMLTWEPKGTNACHVIWRCEVTIPTCTDAGFENRLMAYNYAVQTQVDEQGYATRTITGYLEIPETRIDGGTFVDQGASESWDAATNPPVPTGFRRLSEVTNESLDRRRLDFTVVDTEMPETMLPKGVVECRASHTVQVHLKTINRHTATIRASYTMAKTVNKSIAFGYFLLLIKERWAMAIQNGAYAILPFSLTIEDSDIYGRAAGNFSITYTYSTIKNASGTASTKDLPVDIYNSFLKNIVTASALWGLDGQGLKPIANQSPSGNNWQQWSASMASVFGPGAPGFVYDDDDIIVDLCGTDRPQKPGGAFFRIDAPDIGRSYLQMQLKNPLYTKYDTMLRVMIHRKGVYRPQTPVKTSSGGAATAAGLGLLTGGPAGAVTGLAAYYGAAYLNKYVQDIQLTMSDQAMVVLYYDIIRAGAEPEAPRLTRVGDSTQIFEVNRDQRRQIVANNFGIRSVRQTGYIAYVLISPPPNLPDYPPDYYINDSSSPVEGSNNTTINVSL